MPIRIYPIYPILIPIKVFPIKSLLGVTASVLLIVAMQGGAATTAVVSTTTSVATETALPYEED